MKRDEHRWNPKKPDCEGGRRDFITVGLNEIRPIAVLLILSYALCLSLLVAEIFVNIISTRCNEQIQNKPISHYVS